MTDQTHPYYAIVTFGRPAFGRIREYYRSLSSARADLAGLGGGSMSNARIVGAQTRADARDADIAGPLPVVAHR